MTHGAADAAIAFLRVADPFRGAISRGIAGVLAFRKRPVATDAAYKKQNYGESDALHTTVSPDSIRIVSFLVRSGMLASLGAIAALK